MRYLVDANLSPRVTERLRNAGHEATHVADRDMLSASDDVILAHALSYGLVIVSADTDFTTMLAMTGAKSPSPIPRRSSNRLAPTDQADLIIANLPSVVDDLEAGAVVSLSATHLRVRLLTDALTVSSCAVEALAWSDAPAANRLTPGSAIRAVPRPVNRM